MKDEFKGFSKIFSFTFRQHALSKGFKNATIIIGILCLIVPIIVMGITESNSTKKKADISSGASGEYASSNIKQVLVIDNSTSDKVDLNFLNSAGIKGFDNISYVSCDNIQKAEEQALRSDGHALLMAIDEKDGFYNISLIMPEGTKLTGDDVGSFQSFMNQSFAYVKVQKSGLDYSQLTELSVPVSIIKADTQDGEDKGYFEAKNIMSMVLPYLNIMVLYFMILAYGMDVANSVLMEKSSKLMDTFLIAVKPGAMVMGKVLAIALTGITQLSVWIVCLIGGFAGGTALAKAINPQTNMAIIMLFETFGSFTGMFTIQGVILAVFIILAGFLLYCSIASIGGSLASKPEDLSTTNMLFTLALVISFLCTMYAGGMSGGMTSSAEWLNWFPLTAILVTPSRILVGQVSLLTGFCSMLLVLICSVLIVMLAGRIYKMMSLYKGNPPSIKKVFGMLRSQK